MNRNMKGLPFVPTPRAAALLSVLALALGGVGGGAAGCASEEKQDRDFHTSGNREADQRAQQRISKTQQLRGEGSGEEDKKNGKKGSVKASLFERVGGEEGIALIVEDWVNRSIADPRVNWERRGITQGGYGFSRGKSVEWKPTPENGTKLKKHMVQFLTLSTGGPSRYEGKDMTEAHANMHITNAEFDASVGDLKATLDNLGVPTEEQKELLAIVESTREQVATKR